MSSAHPEAVVLVHGLWFSGTEMALLRRRLRRLGYSTHQFSYPTTQLPVAAHADALAAFAQNIEAATLHFVAHSMGGLVVRYLFARHPDQRPGRIVTLGTPHQGSAVAHWMSGIPLLGATLGKSFAAGLDGNLPAWDGGRDLGVIAGVFPLGFGLLAPRTVRGPGDGTVAVSETRLPGMRAHCTVRASHFGLLFSRAALRQTASFLATGLFTAADP